MVWWLFMVKCKRIILKNFILIILTLSSLRRRKRRDWSCWVRGHRGGEEEEVEGETGEAGTRPVTSRKSIIISVWLYCFCISFQMLLHITDLSPTICFSFRVHIMEGAMLYKKSKAVLNGWNSSARLYDIYLFSGTASSVAFSSSPALVWKHSSLSGHLLLISGVVSIHSWISLRFMSKTLTNTPTFFGHIQSLSWFSRLPLL